MTEAVNGELPDVTGIVACVGKEEYKFAENL